MSIVNRNFSGSEQREVWHDNTGVLATSVTRPFYIAPFNCALEQIKVAATGISGSPTWQFSIDRFITGVGLTTISTFATLLSVQAMGTSGVQSVVLASAGSTLLQMQSGDMLKYVSSGSNSAVTAASITAVVQVLQDVKSFYGTSVT